MAQRNTRPGLLIALSAFLTFSCATPVPPSCIPQDGQEIRIRWGTYIKASEEKHGYELRTSAELFAFAEQGNAAQYGKVARVENEDYCYWQSRVQENFQKIQTLFVLADTSRYVEYSNPRTSTYLRAVWNPRHETYGSREFRELYDSLSALVKHYE